MQAAMLMPVIDVCGLMRYLYAEAIAAMRNASVIPPVFERSGCNIVIAPSSITRVNSNRV